FVFDWGPAYDADWIRALVRQHGRLHWLLWRLVASLRLRFTSPASRTARWTQVGASAQRRRGWHGATSRFRTIQGPSRSLRGRLRVAGPAARGGERPPCQA